MKILITGGAGFIGSACAKKLIDRGDEVVMIDNFNNYYDPQLKRDRLKKFLKGYKLTLYKADIRNKKKMEDIFQKERPDKVIHLAAMAGVRYSLQYPLLYEEVNIKGTINLFEAAVKSKVKNFVYASSSSVYGNNKKYPFSENDSVDMPLAPYPASKKATELFAHVYSHIYGLNTTGLRFFTVYGPWGRPDMALFTFTKNILAGRAIDVYNRGKMGRNFTYIDDIVSGVLTCLDNNQRYSIMNIGGDREEQLSRYIEVLEDCLGKKAKKRLLPMQPGDVPRTVADISRLKKLGWKPTTRIEEGIQNFVKWYKDYYKVK